MTTTCRWVGGFVATCFVASTVLVAAAAPSNVTVDRRVMVWLSDGIGGSKQDYDQTVQFIQGHLDVFTAVSAMGGMVLIEENGDITINTTKVGWHQAFIDMGLQTYPCLGSEYGIEAWRAIYNNESAIDRAVTTLVAAADSYGWDGINVDFEPKTSRWDPTQPPLLSDGLQFGAFMTRLQEALAQYDKEASTDIMTVASACWTAPGHFNDAAPCPWIRRNWEMNTLSESGAKLITMDTYTNNDTTFVTATNLLLHWVIPSRMGLGLCPDATECAALTAGQIAERFQYAQARGIREIDLWQAGSGTDTIAKDWELWWPHLKAFREGKLVGDGWDHQGPRRGT